MAGFEPTTSRLLSGCSTAKLHWHHDPNLSKYTPHVYSLLINHLLERVPCNGQFRASSSGVITQRFSNWPHGPMDKASVFGTEDSRFES